MNLITSEVPMEQNKQERTRICKTEGNKTTEITVEKIDNGYLVETCISDSSDNKYTTKTTKTFSKTNPLEEEEETEEEESQELVKGMSGLLNSLASNEGKINV